MMAARLGSPSPSYFYLLDISRGIAALAVVLWHWQHFFFKGPLPGSFDREAQPFYSIFFLFYEKGWLAVDFFFVLSGFIFFWLYADLISERKIGLRAFFILRISRLYPLHLMTLLIVGALQWLVTRQQGEAFVYSINDTYHFLLNLFFAVAWGLQKGFSFNAPIWSVSVEVLLYAVFFISAWLLRLRIWHVLFFSALGFWLQGHTSFIGRGLFAFYMGGMACFIFAKLNKREIASIWIGFIALLCIAIWAITIFHIWPDRPQTLFDEFFQEQSSLLQSQWTALWMVGFVLPLSVLCMAIFESRRMGHPISGKWLGEISYSSYLLHFPLQLVFFIVSRWLGFDNQIFYSSLVWIGYFLLLIALSLTAHRLFERPMQHLIRRQFSVGR